jgi:hypothetical protein
MRSEKEIQEASGAKLFTYLAGTSYQDSTERVTHTNAIVFNDDLPPLHDAIQRLATTLEREIPGLSTSIETEWDGVTLDARYACPCGEISLLRVVFCDADPPDSRCVPYQAARIKYLLRKHVRGEGNEPNF